MNRTIRAKLLWLSLLMACFAVVNAATESLSPSAVIDNADQIITSDGRITSAYAESYRGADKKQVLILHSYAPGYQWVDNEAQGIQDELADQENLVLRTEYMDTKMINTDEHYRLLRDLYANKYAGFGFDVIISTDDDALRFLRRYRDELFPGVPVVFAGVNYFNESKVEGFSLWTGVNEEPDFASTLDLIVRLHPSTRTLYVVNDTLTTGKFLRTSFEKIANRYADRFDIVYIDDVSFEELQAAVAEIPADSVVFYLSFFHDSVGKTFTPKEVIPVISALSRAPIYGMVDYMLGKGIVGGKLRSGYFQGERAGKLAKRVLAGDPVSSVPMVMESPNQYMFDYSQMARFDIHTAALPSDSIVINEPESFYYKYKRVIWTVVAVFLGLVAYIVVLLFNIKKRIRAQKGLQTIIDASAALFDTSTPDAYKNSLFSKLKSLMPLGGRPLFFKPATAPGWDHPDYMLVTDGPNSGDPAEIAAPVRALLDRSVRENKSVLDKKAGVAYFAGKGLPGNLVYLKAQGRFDDLDRDLLEIFTKNISMAFEGLEKHKMEEALETARKIQMSMLPNNFQSFSEQYGVDLHAFLVPAKEVGGDLYDFFSIDDDHLCFTVGDVSDKGIPAALFMVMAKTLMRSAAEANLNPDDILYKVNNELSRDNEQSMFVTQFLAILNRRTGVMTYANAGHNPPYIVAADGAVTCLHPKVGMVLGAFPGASYEREQIQLTKGDALVIYSDGVTEAKNLTHDMFEEERLEKNLAVNAQKVAKEVVDNLIDDVRAFTSTAPQSDDITVLFVRNRPGLAD